MFCAEDMQRAGVYANRYARAGGLVVGCMDADDLMQEGFLRSMRSQMSVKNSIHFTYVDGLRMKANKGFKRATDIEHSMEIESRGTFDAVVASELWEQVASLPEDVARVVDLRYRCGYDVNEVAEILGLSRSQVARRTKTGLEMLRDIYGKDE